MRPTVLLAATCRWMAPALLARALRNAGHTVEAVCPANHPLSVTTAASRIHPFDAFYPVYAFERAIESASPDLVIPCDDLATTTLHRLHAEADRTAQDPAEIREAIERSLGPPATYPQLASRSRFLSAVSEEGIAAPETKAVESLEALRLWLKTHRFPAVLKADGSSGGVGVRIVKNLAEAEQAFHRLSAPPLAARAIKRAVYDADRTLLLPCLRRERRAVSVQPYIAGREVTCTVACRQGTVLAATFFEVLQVTEPKGPASVIRTIHNETISLVVEQVARHFTLSGICGFDFIIEDETGLPYLIEINPRATQTSHLPLGVGHDLPAALYRALTGLTTSAALPMRPEVIALFPQEWRRDPASDFIASGYHDVPWEEPELVRLGLRQVNRPAWKRALKKLAAARSRREPALPATRQTGGNHASPLAEPET